MPSILIFFIRMLRPNLVLYSYGYTSVILSSHFQGYCDVFLKCRAVDAEGPLARLKNMLFNRETLVNLTQWVTVSLKKKN